ncbi:hypothetical protein U1Q18_027655 [Sarracenia purpurea var. burkii]
MEQFNFLWLRYIFTSAAFTMFVAITFPFFDGLLGFFGGFAFAPTTYFLIPRELGRLPKHQTLDLSNNFTGEIPSSLANLKSLQYLGHVNWYFTVFLARNITVTNYLNRLVFEPSVGRLFLGIIRLPII